MSNDKLTVTSAVFEHNGYMPVQYTGYGIDQSPPITLSGISAQAQTIAVIMVDLDVPFMREYVHWVIWNLPVKDKICEAIRKGEILPELNNARQGIGYGKNQYRGPKPPKFIKKPHRYVFTVYVLDVMLDVESDAGKKSLSKAMQGHILQQASVTGLYKNE